MSGQQPVLNTKVAMYAASLNVPNTTYILLNFRVSVDPIDCLNHRGTLDINQRLKDILNDVG
jgi:hypothetical protein